MTGDDKNWENKFYVTDKSAEHRSFSLHGPATWNELPF